MTTNTGPQQGEGGEDRLFSCRNIRVERDGRTLLALEALEFHPGQITGLIGHNGSGKSTLLKVLAGQMEAGSGEVHYRGKPIKAWERRAFARSLAHLPQDTPPTRGLLVHELVAMGRYPWHGAFGRFGATDREKTEEAMRLTGVLPLADRLVDTLSGGECQRCWIAMMVAQDAGCLLLDEPISALDVAHQIEVLDLVRDLSRSRGLASILVLHDVNMAARYCDRLVALKAGQCVADGTPQALLKPSVLEAIYGLAMNVLPHPGGNGVLAYVD